jgi:hypothetical protein
MELIAALGPRGAGVLGWVTVLGQTVEGEDPGGEASRRLSLAIVGLVVLAGLILVATIVFWRMTRPERATTSTGSMRQIAPIADPAEDPAADEAAAAPVPPADPAGGPPLAPPSQVEPVRRAARS